jgi:hypothetical protein
MKLRTLAIAGATTVAMLAIPAIASACDAEYKYHGTLYCIDYAGNSGNSWTDTKKGSESSSHDRETTNPGGNQPPGKN